MKKKLESDLKVGLFISVGLILVMVSVLSLGSNESLFAGKNHYFTHFDSVDGLIVGAKSILGGVPVGTVEKIELDTNSRNVRVQFSVEKKTSNWIRENSMVEIATQGVLGDKYLSIHMGSENLPVLANHSEIPHRASKDIAQFLSKGDQLLVSLNGITNNLDKILRSFETDNRSEVFFKGMAATATNLVQSTEKMNRELDDIHLKRSLNSLGQILDKVNNGTGTIGSLINDPGIYDELKALLGGANRSRIIRNLVRQTIKESKEESPSPEASSKPNSK